eukprot:tig00020554_g10886.t1
MPLCQPAAVRRPAGQHAKDAELFTDFLMRRLDAEPESLPAVVRERITANFGGGASHMPDLAKVPLLARCMAVPGIPIGPRGGQAIHSGPRLAARSVLAGDAPGPSPAAGRAHVHPRGPSWRRTRPRPIGLGAGAAARGGRDAAPAAQAGRRSRLQQVLAAHLQRGAGPGPGPGREGGVAAGLAPPRHPEPLGRFAEPTDTWQAFLRERTEEIQNMKRSASPRMARAQSARALSAKQRAEAAAPAQGRPFGGASGPAPEPAGDGPSHLDKATIEARKRRKQYEAIVIALTTALKESDEVRFIEVYDSIPKEFSATEVEQMKLDARRNAGLGGGQQVAKVEGDTPRGKAVAFTGAAATERAPKKAVGKAPSRKRAPLVKPAGPPVNLAKGGASSPSKAGPEREPPRPQRPPLSKTATAPALRGDGSPDRAAPRTWSEAAQVPAPLPFKLSREHASGGVAGRQAHRRASRVAVLLSRRASAAALELPHA